MTDQIPANKVQAVADWLWQEEMANGGLDEMIAPQLAARAQMCREVRSLLLALLRPTLADMTNIDRAAEVLWEYAGRPIFSTSAPGHRGWADLSGTARWPYVSAARALDKAGLLAPGPHIIRTREELDALDPDALVFDAATDAAMFPMELDAYEDALPAVVIATGEQVRAVRQALEEA